MGDPSRHDKGLAKRISYSAITLYYFSFSAVALEMKDLPLRASLFCLSDNSPGEGVCGRGEW